MRDHIEAMQCCDCEALLSKGVRAFDWLTRYEESLLEGIRRGLVEPSEALDAALKTLYKDWLLPRDHAEAMIKPQLESCFEPDSVREFRECCEKARDWLERCDWLERTKLARFASEPW